MTPTSIRLSVVIFFLGLLAACAREPGPSQTQTRDLSGFSAIELEGAASIDVTVGAAHAVEIEAPERVLERIETQVRGDTLVIHTRLKDWISTSGTSRVALRISVPELKSLRVGGGNSVQLHGFAGGESNIRAEGAAQIRATGRLDSLRIHLAGAGDGDFRDLTAAHARVQVDGVGNVTVHATDSLDAMMNGVGSITYIGNPSDVKTRMNGLGRISRMDDDADEDDSVPDTREGTRTEPIADETILDSTEVI